MASFGVTPSTGCPVRWGAGGGVPSCWAVAAAGALAPVGVLVVSSVQGVPFPLLAGIASEVGAWPCLSHRPVQNGANVSVNAFGKMALATKLLDQL